MGTRFPPPVRWPWAAPRCSTLEVPHCGWAPGGPRVEDPGSAQLEPGASWILRTLFRQVTAHARIECWLQAAPLRPPVDHSWKSKLFVFTVLFLVLIARWATSNSNRFSKVGKHPLMWISIGCS